MTIKEAIEWLQRLEKKHGGDVRIYFDCPNCEAAFTPNTLATVTVHVGTSDSPKEAEA